MAVQTLQLNTNINTGSSTQRAVRPYCAATETIYTDNNVKPLPPQGHLVDDNIISGTKYFFKDIGYDMKSVKNGYIGTANDHQLGRLNDVGLRLGGIGIATYLASQTMNPKARLMEYIGLAAFLTSMSIYPKIAINTPAKILHGYDIDKEYIDDQGRKKSVHQDSNYIPYDMYLGKNKGEDLDTIGDRMGIPRDIKNRHDVIREQMRKIATQNNTLWMLTAGFATPLMTALLCTAIEKYIVTPELEKSKNAKFNSKINPLLNLPENYEIQSNTVGSSIKHLISKYKGKSIPQEEIENMIYLLTEETDSILSEGIRKDVEKILSNGKTIQLNSKRLITLYKDALESMQGGQTKYISDNILPSLLDIESMIKSIKPNVDLSSEVELSKNEFELLKSKILSFATTKIENTSGSAANHKEYLRANVLKFSNTFNIEPNSTVLSEAAGENLIKFANIIGDFKKKNALLDKCESFKFEHTNETVLANNYEKFQKTLLKVLEISPKEFKLMGNNPEFTKKILDEKLTLLCKNETIYQKALEKLGKIISDMDIALHGSTAGDTSHILDLVNAIDNVYNNTANNLIKNNIGEETVNRLVKNNFGHTVASKEDLLKLLDGVAENKIKYADSSNIEAMKYFSKGKGSSKNLKISRLISRYQGEINAFNRVLHSLDFYKRATNFEQLVEYSSVKDHGYVKNLELKTKDALLNGSISDYILKLGVENAYEYKDLYSIGWAVSPNNEVILSDSTKNALNKNKLTEKLQSYIRRFKDIIANDKTDFTRPNHILNEDIARNYLDIAKTNEAKFNLVSQSPVDMVQKATSKMHADRMWLKTVGILTGIVFGITVLGQFSFGKIRNKNNLQKVEMQVKNESDK